MQQRWSFIPLDYPSRYLKQEKGRLRTKKELQNLLNPPTSLRGCLRRVYTKRRTRREGPHPPGHRTSSRCYSWERREREDTIARVHVSANQTL